MAQRLEDILVPDYSHVNGELELYDTDQQYFDVNYITGETYVTKNKPKHICLLGQHRTLLSGLADMYSNKTLCDVTLIAEDREIKTHKIVLAASSKYFRYLFLFKETHTHFNIFSLLSFYIQRDELNFTFYNGNLKTTGVLNSSFCHNMSLLLYFYPYRHHIPIDSWV